MKQRGTAVVAFVALMVLLVPHGDIGADEPAASAKQPKADIAMDSMGRLTLNGTFVSTPKEMVQAVKKLGVKRGTTLTVRIHVAADFGDINMLAGPLAYAGYGARTQLEPAKPGVVKLINPGKLPVQTMQDVLGFGIGHCGGGRLASSMASPTRGVLVVRADPATLKVVEGLVQSIGKAIETEPAVRLAVRSSGEASVEGQAVEPDELVKEVVGRAGGKTGSDLVFILGKEARPAAEKVVAKLAKAGRTVKSVLIDDLGPGQTFPEFTSDAPKAEIKPVGLPLRELSEVLRGVLRTAIRIRSDSKKNTLEVQGDKDTLLVVRRVAAELAGTRKTP